jgi:glucuronosyltransferase
MKCCQLLLLVVLIASDSTGNSEAARILGAFHFNGKSHFMAIQPLLKGLAARGHQVYVLGHIPLKKPVPNYTDISLEGSVPGVLNSFSVKSALEFGQYFTLLSFFYKKVTDICETVLEHPKVQDLIKSNDTFDLVITEVLGPDCMNAFSYRFNAPIISIISSVILPWGNDRVGNPDHPAYIPSYFLPYTQHMTFSQRLINTILTEVLKLGLYVFGELPTDKMLKKHFGKDVPPLSELKERTSVILVNSHFSLNYPRPTVPAFIEVGGIHIQSNGILPKVI